jgi:hypothetical protein
MSWVTGATFASFLHLPHTQWPAGTPLPGVKYPEHEADISSPNAEVNITLKLHSTSPYIFMFYKHMKMRKWLSNNTSDLYLAGY